MYQPEGDIRTAKFLIVGEAPAAEELRWGRPFVGQSGQIFDEALRNAGINRSDCYITNVFNKQVKKDLKNKSKPWHIGEEPVWSPMKNDFTSEGRSYQEHLLNELSRASSSAVVIGLGNCALRALANQGSITLWRGSFLEAKNLPKQNRAVFSFHPATILYGEDINRWYIVNDFRRAARQAEQQDLIKPVYNFVENPTFSQCIETLRFLLNRRQLFSCDIEVANKQVSMISYGWSQTEAISIPYGMGGWDEQQEILLWQETAELLNTPIPKVFHNAAFDVQFLLQIHKVHVAPPIHDTMVLYAVIYPEFRKSLATLATLYTDQPYWKGLVKHGSVDKEDG